MLHHRQAALLVGLDDEAHAMPMETLEEIRLLSNLESNRHKLLQLVLFGQPELNETLARADMRQLRERINDDRARIERHLVIARVVLGYGAVPGRAERGDDGRCEQDQDRSGEDQYRAQPGCQPAHQFPQCQKLLVSLRPGTVRRGEIFKEF